MNYTWTGVAATLFAAAGLVRGETRRAVFEGAGTETTWRIQDLNPNLPSDWSSFGFLVLERSAGDPREWSVRALRSDSGTLARCTLSADRSLRC